MRRSKTAIKRLFGILMSMIMILGMMTTTAFAADGGATITITKGDIETDWQGMTVNAYMVLNQVNDTETSEGKKQYAVTNDFAEFFNIAAATDALFDGDNDNVYLSYKDNKITYSDKTSAGAISISDAKLDTTYKEADLISRMSDKGKEIGTFYTWIEKYIESKGASLTATKSVSVATKGSTQLVIDELNEGYYALTFSGVPDGISVKQGILVATSGNIELKAEDLPLTKQVKPVDDKTDYAASATAALGEALEYKITSKVPTLTDYSNLTEFVFTDTLVRQVVDSNSFALGIDGVSVSKDSQDKNSFKIGNTVVATLALGNYGNVEYPEESGKMVPGQKFTLTFDTSVLEKYQGKGITLTYQASLTKDAVNVNDNHVSLDYTNGPDKSKLTADTKVYTYGIEVQKTFSDQRETDNTVTFQLRTAKNNEETAISMVGSAGVYHVKANGEATEATETTDLKLALDGKLTITGLDEGTYWLVETAAPTGFTVAKPIQIVLAKDSESPSVLGKDNSTAKYNGEGDSLITGIDSQTNTQISLAQLTVLNQKGFSLPSTGGAGTWMLTIGGILLIAAAGGLYVIYRKKFAAK